MSIGRRRRVASVAITAALVAAVPASGAIERQLEPPDSDGILGGSARGIDIRDALGADDPLAALEHLEEQAESAAGELPEPFAQEVGALPGAYDVRSTPAGDVVGYVVDMPAGEASAALAAMEEERGWTPVPLGGLEGFTFVKEEGECVWVLATCDQVGGSTSVTMRCRYR